jgi:coenzyme F420-0:L-glutamate ligase/coenzyme F420-1:gamma-L-glutamate ligase
VIEIFGVGGLPEVRPGDDLPALIAAAADLRDGDVVVVAQKIVSKAEGALVDPPAGESPGTARRQLARREAVRVVVDTARVLVVETRHGLVCANAGIDASNVPGGRLALLPEDPDASARGIRAGLRRLAGVTVAVVVADTFGRPWRVGQTDVAIGVAGMGPIRDERGGVDREGMTLEVTESAVADAVAAAAELVRRKADGIPVVVVRGLDAEPVVGADSESDSDSAAGAGGGARLLVRPPEEDLFPHGRGWLGGALAGRIPTDRRAGGVSGDDRCTAVAAATAAAGPLARVVTAGDGIGLRPVDGSPPALIAAGVGAGALLAVLLDLGYDAVRRDPEPGEDAAVVVVTRMAPAR